MSSPPHCSILPLLFAAPLAAQTFVVDAAGGAGSSFTNMPAAIALVPDGATLLVRPGHYGSFSISAKSLTILADSGAGFGDVFLGSIPIDALSVGQRAC